ncbi:MAG: DUF3880 domain-containing protein [Lachnospiraceae bacterium]|nr:DUF3880 domain-containing protein [Lachnospiraceae bacterium]
MDYNMFGKNDIIDAFCELGFDVDVEDCPIKHGEESVKTLQELKRLISQFNYSFVFSSNYYPGLSDICESSKVKYISWTYDSPRIALYDKSINNQCNYAFVFDSAECIKLRKKGATRVFYMPLGVNVNRIDRVGISDKDREVFGADVSLVASLYNEEHNLYDRIYERLSDYNKGMFDALIQCQKYIFGGFIQEEVLDGNMVEALYKAMPYAISEGSLADLEYVYANYFLARKTATCQRMDFIRRIAKHFDMKVYSPGNLEGIPFVKHMGVVDYNTDMNKVFKLSKINLNITLPSIQTGIPLRALDIMGAGGFLLTDYRPDFEGLFEPGEDFVYYTSIDDAIEKIYYYIEHEDERINIAENGKNKVEIGFTYAKRLTDMLQIAGFDI